MTIYQGDSLPRRNSVKISAPRRASEVCTDYGDRPRNGSVVKYEDGQPVSNDRGDINSIANSSIASVNMNNYLSATFSGKSGKKNTSRSPTGSAGRAQNLLAEGITPSVVKVMIRIRPCLENEAPSLQMQLEATPEKTQMCMSRIVKNMSHRGEFSDQQNYDYQRIFTEEDKNEDVYTNVAPPVLEALQHGRNATVLAYGQSGAGKTFTMLPLSRSIVDDLFQAIDSCTGVGESVSETEKVDGDQDAASNGACMLRGATVQLSSVQIYMDRPYDLLDVSPEFPRGRPVDKQRRNPSLHPVSNAADARQLIMKAERNRAKAPHMMNKMSSRSHSILTLVITRWPVVTKLTLVDLAGSERMERSGVTGDQLLECRMINKSLSALSLCIQSMGANKDYCPFRSDTLTLFLAESFTIGSCLNLICCVAVSSGRESETRMTLTFADVAKRVKLRRKQLPGAQGQGKVAEMIRALEEEHRAVIEALTAEIGACKREIRRLQGIINAVESGVPLSTAVEEAKPDEGEEVRVNPGVDSKAASDLQDSLEDARSRVDSLTLERELMQQQMAHMFELLLEAEKQMSNQSPNSDSPLSDNNGDTKLSLSEKLINNAGKPLGEEGSKLLKYLNTVRMNVENTDSETPTLPRDLELRIAQLEEDNAGLQRALHAAHQLHEDEITYQAVEDKQGEEESFQPFLVLTIEVPDSTQVHSSEKIIASLTEHSDLEKKNIELLSMTGKRMTVFMRATNCPNPEKKLTSFLTDFQSDPGMFSDMHLVSVRRGTAEDLGAMRVGVPGGVDQTVLTSGGELFVRDSAFAGLSRLNELSFIVVQLDRANVPLHAFTADLCALLDLSENEIVLLRAFPGVKPFLYLSCRNPTIRFSACERLLTAVGKDARFRDKLNIINARWGTLCDIIEDNPSPAARRFLSGGRKSGDETSSSSSDSDDDLLETFNSEDADLVNTLSERLDAVVGERDSYRQRCERVARRNSTLQGDLDAARTRNTALVAQTAELCSALGPLLISIRERKDFGDDEREVQLCSMVEKGFEDVQRMVEDGGRIANGEDTLRREESDTAKAAKKEQEDADLRESGALPQTMSSPSPYSRIAELEAEVRYLQAHSSYSGDADHRKGHKKNIAAIDDIIESVKTRAGMKNGTQELGNGDQKAELGPIDAVDEEIINSLNEKDSVDIGPTAVRHLSAIRAIMAENSDLKTQAATAAAATSLEKRESHRKSNLLTKLHLRNIELSVFLQQERERNAMLLAYGHGKGLSDTEALFAGDGEYAMPKTVRLSEGDVNDN